MINFMFVAEYFDFKVKVETTNNLIKGIMQHFRKYAYSPSCRETDQKIDTTLMLA